MIPDYGQEMTFTHDNQNRIVKISYHEKNETDYDVVITYVSDNKIQVKHVYSDKRPDSETVFTINKNVITYETETTWIINLKSDGYTENIRLLLKQANDDTRFITNPCGLSKRKQTRAGLWRYSQAKKSESGGSKKTRGNSALFTMKATMTRKRVFWQTRRFSQFRQTYKSTYGEVLYGISRLFLPLSRN
jgi:hypothetical protein